MFQDDNYPPSNSPERINEQEDILNEKDTLLEQNDGAKTKRVSQIYEDRRSLLAHKDVAKEIFMLQKSTRASTGLQDSVMLQRGRRSSVSGLRTSVLTGGRNSHVSTLTPAQQLATSEKILTRAACAMLFCVFADAVNQFCVAPNYPLMVSPGAHPDSFPNTEPFDFVTSQYFIQSSFYTGVFLSSLLVGWHSDRVGRRPLVLMNLIASTVITIFRYAFGMRTYWTFVALTFLNGCFGSTPALGLGYMSDAFCNHNQSVVDAYFGQVIGAWVIGKGLGGTLTLIFPTSLFKPLIPAAVITSTGAIAGYFMLLEPKGIREMYKVDTNELPGDKGVGDDMPGRTGEWTLVNIVVGAVVDNIGSIGLVPLCLSPLMFESFYLNFIEEGLEPIMTEQVYRWIYSMTAIIAIPGAVISPWAYKNIGVALCCVLANLVTGAAIVGLLFLGTVDNPTTLTFAGFVTVLYLVFPLALLSDLSTSPLLDRVAPPDKRGFYQSFNTATADGTSIVFPFVFGVITDKFGIAPTLWICTGISVLAAIVNLPLVFHPAFQKEEVDNRAAEEEDTVASMVEEELIERVQRGDFVPSKDLFKTNFKRMERGEAFVMTPWGEYNPANMPSIPLEEYEYLKDLAENQLRLLRDAPEHKDLLIAALNGLHSDEEETEHAKHEMGEWFADYLLENGYHPGEHAPMLKHAFTKSFPRLSDKIVDAETMESRLLKIIKWLNDMIQRDGLDDRPWWFNLFSKGQQKSRLA